MGLTPLLGISQERIAPLFVSVAEGVICEALVNDVKEADAGLSWEGIPLVLVAYTVAVYAIPFVMGVSILVSTVPDASMEDTRVPLELYKLIVYFAIVPPATVWEAVHVAVAVESPTALIVGAAEIVVGLVTNVTKGEKADVLMAFLDVILNL